MRILVTDGNTLPGLAITRALGQAGHEVFVGYHKSHCIAGYSRYAYTQCVYPDPIKRTKEFIEFLLDYVESNQIDSVFPVTDITTLPITKHKTEFEKHTKIPFADYGVVDTAANKAEIMKIADSLGIDTPKSVILNSLDDAQTKTVDFPYPLVIKPARSRVLTDRGWIFTSVTYAENEKELLSKLRAFSPDVFPVILQEKISGPGVGIFMCYDRGMPVASFSHERVREKPPSGGVSVLRKSVPLDPIAYEFSKKLLSKIEWEGVAMVEFKVDERDNRPKLMEINGRFWGSLQLAIDSGVNFPCLLADSLGDSPATPVTSYKYGVQTRWLWGDIDALLIRMLKSSRKQLLPAHADSKLVYLLKFMKLWGRDLHYDVLRFTDIKPWLYETYLWFKKLI